MSCPFYGGRVISFVPLIITVILMLFAALSHGGLEMYGVAPCIGLISGLFLSKSAKRYATSASNGLVKPVFGIMVMAVPLAGVVGVIVAKSGVVTTLASYMAQVGFTGPLFVVAAFLITCVIAFSTGTSFGTIFVCAPILYPIGYLAGADPAILIGALVAGGAFGDNLAPVSDTTIASSQTQGMDIGGVVKSRLKYVLPVAVISAVLYLLVGWGRPVIGGGAEFLAAADPVSLVFLLVPAVVIILCLLRKHLLVALAGGIAAGFVLGLATGIFSPADFFNIPQEWASGGLIFEGLTGTLSAITILIFLFPVLQIMEDGGGTSAILDGLTRIRMARSPRTAEASIGATTIGLNVVTALNTAAIVATGPIAMKLGKKYNIHGYRRANLLDCFGNTFNYLIPYNAVLIVASMFTMSCAPIAGAEIVSPLGMIPFVFYSWVMLAFMAFSVITGYGRTFMSDAKAEVKK